MLGNGPAGTFGCHDDLVIYIREVHYKPDVQTAPLQMSMDEIEKQERSEIADVCVIVNRWTTSIYMYPPFPERHKRIEGASRSVVDLERHSKTSGKSGYDSHGGISPLKALGGQSGLVDLKQDLGERGRRVSGLSDGATNHQVVGARCYRVSRGGDPILITRIAPGRTNPRRHD